MYYFTAQFIHFILITLFVKNKYDYIMILVGLKKINDGW